MLAEASHDLEVAHASCRLERSPTNNAFSVSKGIEAALASCRLERSPTIFVFGPVSIDIGLLAEVLHDLEVALDSCRLERSPAFRIDRHVASALACSKRYRTTSR